MFEKRMQPELRRIPFYIFLLFLPVAASLIISLLLESSPFMKLRTDIAPHWISFCKSMAPGFLIAHSLFWFYGVKCLRKQNEIFIPKFPLRALFNNFKARRASDFAMYFTLAGAILVLTILPWALLKQD